MAAITKKSLLSYSMLAFCLSFIGLPIYIYLPNYYADNFGVSLTSIAAILLFTRLIDTVQDPLFGILSDKFPTYKKHFISYLCPLLGISFLFLFYPLTSYIKVWLTVMIITTYSIFSLIYINYQSYAVSLTSDYHLKTEIISYREIGFVGGVIFAAATPAMLFKHLGEVNTFLVIGIIYFIIISVLGALFMKLSSPITKERLPSKSHEAGALRKISHIKPFRDYFLMFFLNAISSSIPATLIIFFVGEVINAKNLVGLFLVLYFLGVLFGVVLWTKVSKALNSKVSAFLLSIVLTIAIFIWCYFLGEGDVLTYGVICVLSGLGFGGDFALSYSILTDLIQDHKMERFESTIFGISNFIIKIALTLVSSCLIYIIGILENPAQFISFSYALLPAFFRISGGCVLYKNFKSQ